MTFVTINYNGKKYLNSNVIYILIIRIIRGGNKAMKKIQIVIVLSMLILIGFRTFALPLENSIENNSLNTQVFGLEIIVEGGFLGYTVTIINTGAEQVRGNLTIEIITDTMVVLFGGNLSKEKDLDLNPINGIDTFKLQPLIGFGSASIHISGIFKTAIEEYPFETFSNGYTFLIYLICDKTSINIP